MTRTIFLAVATGIAVGAIFSGLLVSGVLSQDGPKLPPGEAFYQRATVEQATAEARPRAPKPYPPPTRPPTPTSCPRDPKTFHSGVYAYGWYQPAPSFIREHADKTFVSQAFGVDNEGRPYTIYSGSFNAEPQQGLLIVYKGVKDPCAEAREQYEPQLLLTPFKSGALTLLTIDEDTVTFKTADGTLGRFDFTTGIFQ